MPFTGQRFLIWCIPHDQAKQVSNYGHSIYLRSQSRSYLSFGYLALKRHALLTEINTWFPPNFVLAFLHFSCLHLVDDLKSFIASFVKSPTPKLIRTFKIFFYVKFIKTWNDLPKYNWQCFGKSNISNIWTHIYTHTYTLFHFPKEAFQ